MKPKRKFGVGTALALLKQQQIKRVLEDETLWESEGLPINRPPLLEDVNLKLHTEILRRMQLLKRRKK